MNEKTNPANYAVIPADVRYDPELKPNAKLLYAELTALCGKNGYCWATNEYFARLYGLSPKSVSRLIVELEKRGYIRCEIAKTKAGSQRRIYADAFQAKETGGMDKNADTPPDKNAEGGMDKNAEQNNIIINNIPPYNPPRGADANSDDLFPSFWAAYPKKKAKDKAYRAWKKLKPDLNLCRAMSDALERDKRSEAWRKEGGRFVPYPATWLNGRRWEDEPDRPEDPPNENLPLRGEGVRYL